MATEEAPQQQQQIQLTGPPDAEGFVEARLGNLPVRVRVRDGWIDASALSISAGKRVNDWHRMKGTIPIATYDDSRSSHFYAQITLKSGTSQKLEFFRSKIGGEVIELRNGTRTFMHRKLAVQFAQWLSDEYAWAVSEIVNGYETGQLEIAAGVIENYDRINGTRTEATLVTQPAEEEPEDEIMTGLLNNDQPVEYKRRLGMERTKKANRALVDIGFGARELKIKNNSINQATFGYTCTTSAFKKKANLKKSPRCYATSSHLVQFFLSSNPHLLHLLIQLVLFCRTWSISLKAVRWCWRPVCAITPTPKTKCSGGSRRPRNMRSSSAKL